MSVDLRYVPLEEFRRIRQMEAPASDRALMFATAVRLNALYMIKRAGSGHIGTSFSCADILTALHLGVMDPAQDTFFSSKGHDAPALYATLIGLERLPFEKIHELRRMGGLPGHPDVATPHVSANTGSLGMGISKAKGMARAQRLAGETGRIYVLTGDGELQEGQIWESLQSASNGRLHEIAVIVDRNRIQSDTWVRDVNDYGDLRQKFEAFGWDVADVDGHDPIALDSSLRENRPSPQRPRVLLAETKKGAGVSFMEGLRPGEALYRYHSGAPSDEDYAQAVDELAHRLDEILARLGQSRVHLATVPQPSHRAPKDPQALIPAYSKALVAAAERDPRIVALDADLVLDTGLIPFQKKFPDRFIECGIAEQDMVSQAGGLALKGFLPFCHSFSCFLSARPNEQIYTNATERTKIVYVGSLAGLVPGGPGHSHQCVRDISSLAAIPGLTLLEPCTEEEVGLAVAWAAFTNPQSTYLRLTSVKWDVPFETPATPGLHEGRGSILAEGTDAVVIGYGPVLLSEAWHAVQRLRADGVSVRLVNLPWLNRVDPAWLREVVQDVRWLFTLDNHYVRGGQGEMILATLAELDLVRPPRARRLGLREIPACGKNEEVLAHHRLDSASLAEDIGVALGRPVAAERTT